ncbi:hypothetical protein JW905_18560 [bacterium]|nr:hypothetical protein [candidate division CSSED10-310 bacterium]
MNGAYGSYTGDLLRINLTTGEVARDDTSRYLPAGIGGRGMAARIAWEEITPAMTAFAPETPLLILTGPLTGTMAPFSGRTTVCGLSAQGYPHEWYTRSSFGGHWGPALKHAGFDGLIITGRAPSPTYLLIDDGHVTIGNADPLWGKGIYETQRLLIERHGRDHRVFAIGPAGENLVRIAVAATETESASGQGGFGAVMGSKRLKAIVVHGTRKLPVAMPEEFMAFCRAVREESHGSHGWPHTPRLDPERVEKYGQKFHACTQGCAVRCFDARYYTRVPGKLCKGKLYAGQVDCIAQLFPGAPGTFYDWKIGFEAGFELGVIANDIGLNHWELLVGLMPWLRSLAAGGALTEIDGRVIDLDDPRFWEHVMHGIGHRLGPHRDALAEGTVRAAYHLGTGVDRMEELFPAWGYAGHWDGHGDHINRIFFPFWIVAALQWAVDTRDPISSGHGYVQNVMGWCKEHSPVHGISWERIIEIGRRVYGDDRAMHPESGYASKAFPAYWHGHRSVLKDSLPVDDQVFPRVFSKRTDDNFAMVGGVPGPEVERHLLKYATGIDWSSEELETACDRIIQLERALLVRNFNRSRVDDETLIPYLERPDNLVNPFLGERQALDAGAFRKVLDEYYALRGWDHNGRPTRARLARLGLDEVATELEKLD